MSAPDPILEAAAIAAWKSGDRRAGDTLLRMHEGLIRSAARSYVTDYCEIDDLVQMVRLALLDAALVHDASRAKLSTFAFRGLKWAARKYRRDGRYIVKGSLRSLCTEDAHRFAVRLDAPIGDNDTRIIDHIVALEPEETTIVDVAPLLAALPPHERDIIERHYSEPSQTLEQIGEARGVSKQAAHDMKNRAIARMRFAAGVDLAGAHCSKRNAALAKGRAAAGVTALRCSLCNGERHNRRTCPLRQAA